MKGSPDILVNDRAALRVGDTYAKHGPSAHAGAVKTGSPTVWFNDVQAARVDDPIDCGSKVAEGSPDVEIGDAKPGDPSAKLNAVLAKMNPGNLPESIQTAEARKSLAKTYQKDAEALGAKYHLPPALILALMSRESGFGTLLDDGWGDHHHGFGILQVDNRSHTPVGGPYSMTHMNQAMGIFEGGLSQVKAEHPTWTSDQQLAGAVAAYNAGPKNIQTEPTGPSSWAQMDEGTTGNNYSRDTWAQAQWFANNLKW